YSIRQSVSTTNTWFWRCLAHAIQSGSERACSSHVPAIAATAGRISSRRVGQQARIRACDRYSMLAQQVALENPPIFERSAEQRPAALDLRVLGCGRRGA